MKRNIDKINHKNCRKNVVQTHQETSSSLLLHKSADISPMTQINISTPNILDGLKGKTKDVFINPISINYLGISILIHLS